MRVDSTLNGFRISGDAIDVSSAIGRQIGDQLRLSSSGGHKNVQREESPAKALFNFVQ